MVVLSTKLQEAQGGPFFSVSPTCPAGVCRLRFRTRAPLRPLVERPQLQVELRLRALRSALLHGGQPVAGPVEGGADHLKLLQAQLVDELLLHDVQLGGQGHKGAVSTASSDWGGPPLGASSSGLRCRAVCPSGGSKTAGVLDSRSAPATCCAGPPSAPSGRALLRGEANSHQGSLPGSGSSVCFHNFKTVNMR